MFVTISLLKTSTIKWQQSECLNKITIAKNVTNLAYNGSKTKNNVASMSTAAVFKMLKHMNLIKLSSEKTF